MAWLSLSQEMSGVLAGVEVSGGGPARPRPPPSHSSASICHQGHHHRAVAADIDLDGWSIESPLLLGVLINSCQFSCHSIHSMCAGLGC